MSQVTMAKKKTDKKPTKAKAADSQDRLKLSEAVAAVVQIVEVRLFESHVRLGSRAGEEDQTEISLRHRARTLRHDDLEHLLVMADFVMEEAKDESEFSGESDERFLIAATFRLEYEVPDITRFTDEQLQAFGHVNGVYNAWPFWREYVYSVMARMGLPPMTLPVYRADM